MYAQFVITKWNTLSVKIVGVNNWFWEPHLSWVEVRSTHNWSPVVTILQ